MFQFSNGLKNKWACFLKWKHDFKITRHLIFEIVGFILILLAGVLPRLIFVSAYPTRPVSDFGNIFNLAESFEKDILAKGNPYWHYFSAGLPLILSFLFRVIPYPSEDVARWATAITSGLCPLLPFLMWKDAFTLRVRILAGLLLAFWPGQIFFSGILAQDNWIIFPTVGLAALAVRTLVQKEDGYPILAGLFYFFTVAIRQEMLLALLPLLAVAVLGSRRERWFRNSIICIVLISSLFSLLIIQRGMATGRYALSTDHLGVSILGAYIPGAAGGWTSPIPYLEKNHPEILDDEDFEQQASALAWQEFARRPGFHVIRMAASSLYYLTNVDNQLAYWSLSAEGALPHRFRRNAKLLQENLTSPLYFYTQFIHWLFLSAVFFSFTKAQYLKWISPILLASLLKIGLHAVIVSQPRYSLVVMAMEILVIALVWDGMFKSASFKLILSSIVMGLISMLLLIFVTNAMNSYVKVHDVGLLPDHSVAASPPILSSHLFNIPLLIKIKIV
jgi:hypothetical protein